MYAKHDKLRQPGCRLMAPPRGTPVNIRIYLIFPATKSYCLGLHFDTDNMGLHLLLFTRLSLKVEPSESKRAGTKTEFDMK